MRMGGSPDLSRGPLPPVTPLTLSSPTKATPFRIILWRCSAHSENGIARPTNRLLAPQLVGVVRQALPSPFLMQRRKLKASLCYCTADLAVIPRRALANPGQPLL